ncbi:TetR/AcrR family transcriptional regulator [Sphingomonas colocasiae]|uniref:TetR/AcrR family transcriptional regulator n=1 Tax=Sphingomonas colocasiae TaxID=1848973 RepID=A0ABS7PJQ8_9SPHN|nr:TetR/AcrR family transcriptional regulator [Sphingomonas colocasiae]MBY8821527.1 TetR/AcrR family transcriptional regulator [Sphingomonas colocasiae]
MARASALKTEVAALKRARILEHSRELFARKGYQNTTLDEIAGSLEVTKPFIYSYYANKGAILFEISQLGIACSLQVMNEIRAHDISPREKLFRLVEEVTVVTLQNQDNLAVYLREEKELDPDRSKEIMEKRGEFDHGIADILEDGIAKGQFDINDVSVTSKTIGGMISWVVYWYRPGGSQSHEAVGRMIADMVMKIVSRPG